MSAKCKLPADPEVIRSLYCIEGLDQAALAQRYAVTQVAVSRYMRRHGIPARAGGTSRAAIDLDELRRYLDEGLTLQACATIFGCHRRSIYRALERAGIERALSHRRLAQPS